MLKKALSLLFILVLTIPLASCSLTGTVSLPSGESSSEESQSESSNNDSQSSAPAGDASPSFKVAWPAEMLPSDFPNLGEVSKVIDSRTFGKRISIYWNILSKSEADALVDKLNAYLDFDHEWQGNFYSDGIKYKSGTEDTYIDIVIRYQPTATGTLDPLDAQFYLEISGEGLAAK